MLRHRPLALAGATVALLAGCAAASAPAGPEHARLTPGAAEHRVPFTAWPTYHRDPARSGTAHPVGTSLHVAWTRRLDGAVYGEPLLVHGLLIAATEQDSVYALRPRTGHVVWRRHLGTPQPQSGLPCGDIFPLGITGTPAYDAGTGSVFVAAETVGGHHTLWALSARTGHRRWHRSLDVLGDRDRYAEQERGALLVAHHRVYTAFGGLYGDCGNYVGYVTSVPVSGHGRTYHYAVPTAREAGIWAPPGPVEGKNGNIYVESGNGAATGGRYDGSDSVIELTPKRLHRVAFFAPRSWAADNAQDADLGSSSPAPVAGRILAAGKTGAYLLRPSLGGIGAELDSTGSGSCAAFGGSAHQGHVAVLPCMGGIRAIHVGKHRLRWEWTANGIYGSPVIAGRHVYVADRDSGDLVVLSRATGAVQSRSHAGNLTHFPSQVVDGGMVFVPTLGGITAFR